MPLTTEIIISRRGLKIYHIILLQFYILSRCNLESILQFSFFFHEILNIC